MELESGRGSCWVTQTSTFTKYSLLVYFISLSLSVAMSGVNLLGSLVLCALFLPLSEPSGQLLKCHEVRSSFQTLHPGTKWAPETPVSGTPVMLNRFRKELLILKQWGKIPSSLHIYLSLRATWSHYFSSHSVMMFLCSLQSRGAAKTLRSQGTSHKQSG